jgi:hypothetical protein
VNVFILFHKGAHHEKTHPVLQSLWFSWLFAAVPQTSVPSGFFIGAMLEVSNANLE